ncbi:hypothetical protein [Sutterella sp.]
MTRSTAAVARRSESILDETFWVGSRSVNEGRTGGAHPVRT